MICQTLDWSEFSNISKLRDVFDKLNCTDDTRERRREPTDQALWGEGDTRLPLILPFKIGVKQGWKKVKDVDFVLVLCVVMGYL